MRRWILAAAGLAVLAQGGCAPSGTVALSPDGTRVAAIWPVGQEVKLASGGIDGAGWAPMADVNIDGGLSWSPDGRWIAVHTAGGVRLFDTRLGRFRGSFGPRSTGPVAWRADSAQVAYLDRAEDSPRMSLVTYGMGEQRETGRTALPEGFAATAALWLPESDGQALLDDQGDVWAAEQGEVRRVATTKDVVGMALSADGGRLIWARQGRSPRQTLMTVWAYDLQRRSVQRLPFADRVPGTLDAQGQAPTSMRVVWSPRAERMVFIGDYASKTSRALVLSADGGTARQLATAPGFLDAAWSADGRRVVLMNLQETTVDVTTFAADGSDPRRVANKVWRAR